MTKKVSRAKTVAAVDQNEVNIDRIILLLQKRYPDADCTLDFSSAWELLIGGIIGAQCTDERVNLITPVFHSRFPTLADVAAADISAIEDTIKSCGLFRNKAKAIKGSALMIMGEFDGRIPDSEEELLRLPGVGRKIANLVLSDYFKKPAIVVDTHCGRISRLIGLTESKNPDKIEADLKDILPVEAWVSWGHMMVAHGRAICQARCRRCAACPLLADCAYGRQVEIEAEDLRADGKQCY